MCCKSPAPLLILSAEPARDPAAAAEGVGMTTASPLPGGPFLHRGVLRLEGEGLPFPPLLLPSPPTGVYREATPAPPTFPEKKDTVEAAEEVTAERDAERDDELEEEEEEGPWWGWRVGGEEG